MGPLANSGYGGTGAGYLARFKNRFTIGVGAQSVSGYVVWFPEYFGQFSAAANDNINTLVWANASSSANPTNTTTDPAFAGAVLSSGGWSVTDPAHTWVDGSSTSDARAVAACLKMRYLGKLTDIAGEVAIGSGITRDQIMSGGGSVPPSVDEMFNLCGQANRMSMDDVEIRYRPSTSSAAFRTVGGTGGAGILNDNCLSAGVPGSSTTKVGATGASGSSEGIVIAWRGSSTGNLSFELYKGVEWRPRADAGITMPTPTTTGAEGVVSKSLAYLDKHYPSWQRTGMNIVRKGTQQLLAQALYGGQVPAIGTPLLMN